jgi:hypothetical protein
VIAREISTAKGPSEAVALWSSHTQKQFGVLTEQFKELAALGQRIASSSGRADNSQLEGLLLIAAFRFSLSDRLRARRSRSMNRDHGRAAESSPLMWTHIAAGPV